VNEIMPGEKPEAAVGMDAYGDTEALLHEPAANGAADAYSACATCFVVAWSLLETRWELDGNSSAREISAVLVSKSLLLLVAGLCLRGSRAATYAMLFICLMSMLAVAPEISVEYERSPALAVLSAIECAGKLAAFVTIALCLRRRRGRRA
jgi:hypothetical protein